MSMERLYFELKFVKYEHFISKRVVWTWVFAVIVFFASYCPIVYQHTYDLRRYASRTAIPSSPNITNSSNTSNSSIEYGFNCPSGLSFASVDFVPHSLAVILLVAYTFTFKRKRFGQKCCRLRPGVPRVISLFGRTKRFTSSLVHCLISYEIVVIVTNKILKEETLSDVIEGLVQDPTHLLNVFLEMLEVVLAPLRYSPVIIAIRHESLWVLCSGTAFLWVDFIYFFIVKYYCQPLFETYLITQAYVTFDLLTLIPHLFVFSLLLSILTYKSFAKTRKAFKLAKVGHKDQCFPFHIRKNYTFFSIYDLQYCQQLLNRNKSDAPSLSLFQKYIYKWDPEFKFTSQMISIHLICVLSLFYTFFRFNLYPVAGHLVFTGMTFNLTADGNNGTQYSQFYVSPVYLANYILASCLSFVLCLLQILLGLRNVKRQLKRLYKGELKMESDPELFEAEPHNILENFIKFSGFTVSYLIWGFILITATVAIIMDLAYFFIINYLTLNAVLSAFFWVLAILPAVVCKAALDYCLVKFVFLQKAPKVALDNARLFNAYIYFTFFVDCIIGAFSAVRRILQSAVATLVFMPRIGYQTMGQQLSKLDEGYQCFHSYLNVEVAHSHPVLLTFCAFLYCRRQIMKSKHNYDHPTALPSIAVKRWQLAYTLISNPSLSASRRPVKKALVLILQDHSSVKNYTTSEC